jgi:hypothetical protein
MWGRKQQSGEWHQFPLSHVRSRLDVAPEPSRLMRVLFEKCNQRPSLVLRTGPASAALLEPQLDGLVKPHMPSDSWGNGACCTCSALTNQGSL